MGKEMMYSEFVEMYDLVDSTSKRLEKESFLSEFLKKLAEKGEKNWSYLIKGKVFPDYDSRELGISRQLAIKGIARALGISDERVSSEFRKKGDLGIVAESFVGNKAQSSLFSKTLTARHVFEVLRKLTSLEGKGSVDRKMSLISELLGNASGKEAKYVVRTLLGDLRIGISDGTIRDAFASSFFPDKDKKEISEKIQNVYDLTNDYEVVFDSCVKGLASLNKVKVKPGRPMNPSLAIKAKSVEEAFKVCGRPAAFEYKYDGFRVLINKDKKGIKLFTRRLEDVSKQFPDVVNAIEENVKGESFVLDSEVVGYDPKTEKYQPFQHISQRIKRKYDIDKLIEKLPVEINVFDVMFLDGESKIDLPFSDRRKLVEKVVNVKEKVIRPSRILITDSDEDAEKFYQEALEVGEEGVMIKNLSLGYQPGRKVGYMAKLKPELKDLDLVIIGAEHGTGKRAGWLTSYYVACKNEEGEFLEIGKVSSGLKEKESEDGTTFEEMSKMLEPLVERRDGNKLIVKPKIVVSVNYQNIQKSPSYNSGYALRFPRITAYRPDRNINDIADIGEIEELA